jgi:hypothetical protein
MAFMNLYSDYFAAYLVETKNGSELVPCNLLNRPFTVGECEEDGEVLADLIQYCEDKPHEYTVVQGWFARYSAPGYLDCTNWVGPCATEQEAIDECKELYGDEDE